MIYAFLLVIAVFALFPVIYILLGSFKSNKEILVGGLSILPTEWHFENYIQAWKLADFGRLTFNSIFYAVVVVGGCVADVDYGRLCLCQRDDPVFQSGECHGALLHVCIDRNAVAYPQPVWPKCSGSAERQTDHHPCVWHECDAGVYRYRLCPADIQEIDEAAQIDGAGFFKIFWRIIFPLCKPLVATTDW